MGEACTYLDETLDALLDAQRVRLEPTGELPSDFVDEVVVRHMLAILHDPNDTRLQCPSAPYLPSLGSHSVTHLRLMSTLLLDTVLRLLPLVRVLHPRCDGADLDLLQRCGEVRVERERVVRVDVPPRWMLLEDLVLCAGERL